MRSVVERMAKNFGIILVAARALEGVILNDESQVKRKSIAARR
jgi:hypothetical protein